MGEVILSNERWEGSTGFLGPCSCLCKGPFTPVWQCKEVWRWSEKLRSYPVSLWLWHSSLFIWQSWRESNTKQIQWTKISTGVNQYHSFDCNEAMLIKASWGLDPGNKWFLSLVCKSKVKSFACHVPFSVREGHILPPSLHPGCPLSSG